jgi:two-component system KDP operon response regulator KdpE
MTRVLCIDDDPNMRRTLAANLRARGFEVDLADSGERALQSAKDKLPDVIILDLGLPGISGMEVIRTLRHWTTIPIIVLSARDAEFDKIGALNAGADDYVSKPFGMGELLARVRAAVRRGTPSTESPLVTTPDFTLDLEARRATVGTTDTKLTPTEWHIVEVLVRNAGRLVTGKTLLQAVWGPEYGNETNYLRVHMAHIRRKLEPEPSHPHYFHTEAGMGYRFSPEEGR